MYEPRPIRRTLFAGALLFAASTMTACASTGATFRSGVGDTFPEHPPYYAGLSAGAVATEPARIGYLPIVFQRGASQAAIFDPRSGPGTSVGALLEEMNAYLDTLARASGLGMRLAEGGKVSAVAHAATTSPPDVRFGCITETGAPDDECLVDRSSALGRGRQQMRLAVGRPSPEWTAWMQELLTNTGAERALLVTLEVGQMLPRQTGARGDKEIELGTRHVERLPWLTSLETPVQVLQLTGAVVDRDGKALRIGAEGILARRTRLLVSAVGGQEMLSDDDVNEARARRREDLPGQPTAWRIALQNLVAQLTGRGAAP
jgi:hypothetical protein